MFAKGLITAAVAAISVALTGCIPTGTVTVQDWSCGGVSGRLNITKLQGTTWRITGWGASNLPAGGSARLYASTPQAPYLGPLTSTVTSSTPLANFNDRTVLSYKDPEAAASTPEYVEIRISQRVNAVETAETARCEVVFLP